jgi:hypothetical protein
MSRKTLLLAISLTVTATVTVAGVMTAARPHAAPPLVELVETSAAKELATPPLVEPVETAAAKAPAAPPPIEVLHAWDAARADAWARGDLRLLSSLYTRGSEAGRRDRAMLGAWVARGLVVRGMTTQLLAVRAVNRTASTWTLRVTDRMAGGIAVGGGVRRPLPTDAATTRTVELRLVSGRWRVAAVLPR